MVKECRRAIYMIHRVNLVTFMIHQVNPQISVVLTLPHNSRALNSQRHHDPTIPRKGSGSASNDVLFLAHLILFSIYFISCFTRINI